MHERDLIVLRRAIREELQVSAFGIQCSRPSVDQGAELLLIGAAIFASVANGLQIPRLSSEMFYGDAHRLIWDCAANGDSWPDIRRQLQGDELAVDVFYGQLKRFEWVTQREVDEAAEKLEELHARRRLRALMQRLDIELANGLIDCGDAETELQRHLSRGPE